MKFADQSAVISGIGDQPCNQRGIAGKGLVAITRVVQAGWIHSSHKTGTTWRADRALAKGVCESDPALQQAINHRGGDVLIAEGCDRVKPLLVRAIPKNIRGCCGQGIGAKASFGFQEKMVVAIVRCQRHLAANVLAWGIRMSGGLRFSRQMEPNSGSVVCMKHHLQRFASARFENGSGGQFTSPCLMPNDQLMFRLPRGCAAPVIGSSFR